MNASDPGAGASPSQPPSAGAALRPGELIADRYDVLATLGRGGMGVVYRARDRELDEVVALKLLVAGSVRAPEAVERFRREVKLARRVTHRGVARTFDIGRHGEQWFLTMELIEGEPLAARLQREGALEPSSALGVARDIADALAAAHEVGVIHRDLKPENVLLAPGGRVVLTDFGIARARTADAAAVTSGEAWGTPSYMAPEQVEGRPELDERVDVYAFGALLYEMLTGTLAWSGSSAYVVAMARLSAPPPDPGALRPELAPALRELVMRCMARQPEDRLADGQAIARALEQLTLSEPRPGQAAPVGAPADRSLAAATTGARLERREGAGGFRKDLAEQLQLMGGASPAYRRVLHELDALLEAPSGAPIVAALERVWQKRSFEGPYERPLLLLAALRGDALAEGPTHPLHDAIAAAEPDATAVTAQALAAALRPDRLGFWITLRSRRVQTNEVSRSLSWRWPALLAGAEGRARPMMLFDVGASAGLNLVADKLDLRWRREGGEALQVAGDLDVVLRLGFDPRPLDVRNEDDREWLRACIWPEQRERFARLESAMAAFRATVPAPQLVLARASSAPARLAKETASRPAALAIAVQTLVRGYIPVAERGAYEQQMRDWLAAGPPGQRLWSQLELEEVGEPELSCALDVAVGTGGAVEVVRLGRTSYHPQTIEVAAGAEARLRELTRARA